MVNTDNTNNVNMFGGQQMSAEQFAAISKIAAQQAEQNKKLQEMQQKAINDKIAQLKGESEDEIRAKKLRERKELVDKAELKALEAEQKRQKETNQQKEMKCVVQK